MQSTLPLICIIENAVHHETTTHDQLQAAADLAGLEMRASEIHGLVCGEICRRLRFGPGADFPALLGIPDSEDGTQRAVLDAVDELMSATHRDLDEGMQFALLLPDDDEPLADRTDALADWARGFTLALLRGEDHALKNFDGDSAEVVRDLLKISEARPGEDPEEDERALAELEEYIRVGVQLVFEELQPDKPEQPDQGVH
jgi:uncharacterized protein